MQGTRHAIHVSARHFFIGRTIQGECKKRTGLGFACGLFFRPVVCRRDIPEELLEGVGCLFIVGTIDTLALIVNLHAFDRNGIRRARMILVGLPDEPVVWPEDSHSALLLVCLVYILFNSITNLLVGQ